MGPIFSLADFLDMLRRRAGVILTVLLIGCIASVFWALGQTHLYVSSEVIQIEQPRINDELAPSAAPGSSARRLQLIEQQMMARSNLIEIIEKYGLFANLPDKTQIEKAQMLREAITITGIAAAREGFADDGTISVLTITAMLDSAASAQAVAHEIADRTRALAAQGRRERARETMNFFLAQEENLIADIAILENEITAFSSDNDLSLEGSIQFRQSEIARLDSTILELDREIIAAQLAYERIDTSARAATVKRAQDDLTGQIESLTTQRQLLENRREAVRASIVTTPEIDKTLAQFDRRREQLQNQLEIISARRSEAEVAYTLESADRGERLITIEEAPLPEYPVTPSRKMLALVGAAASFVAALVVAFLLELRHPVLRSARQMERETGLVPVVSIPEMTLPQRPNRLQRIWSDRSASGRAGRRARQKKIARPEKT